MALPNRYYRRAPELDGMYRTSQTLCPWHDGCTVSASVLTLRALDDQYGARTFFSATPATRPGQTPSLSELHISEAGQVEKTAHRPRHMSVPEHVAGSLQDREVRHGSNSAAGNVTPTSRAFPNSDMAVHMSGQQYPNLSVHQTGGCCGRKASTIPAGEIERPPSR